MSMIGKRDQREKQRRKKEEEAVAVAVSTILAYVSHSMNEQTNG